MANIAVVRTEGNVYRVTVEEGGSTTRHDVTVTDIVAERYAPGQTAEALVTASFEFLLAREPKESILTTFDLPVIERYFPEYPRVIAGMVGGG
jgi:hypothetical protein